MQRRSSTTDCRHVIGVRRRSPDESTGARQTPTPEATMPDFALTSTAFDPGGAIPRRFTCDGEDVSPELSWSGTPDGTAALDARRRRPGRPRASSTGSCTT